MKWALGVLVGVCIVVWCNSPVVAAQEENQWMSGVKVSSRVQSSVYYDTSSTCGGQLGKIAVANEPSVQLACIYGEADTFRMARYVNNRGDSLLVASYPTDAMFYVVRGVCSGVIGCVYSQYSDTLLFRAQVGAVRYELRAHASISKKLSKRFDPSVMNSYYSLDGYEAEAFNGGVGGSLPVGRMGVSTDGRWVALEYINRGAARIDMRTGDVRRVVPFSSADSSSGYYEFAISLDGKTMAYTSEKSGLMIVGIDDTCGDRVTVTGGSSFPEYVRACSAVYPDMPSMIAQYYSSNFAFFTGGDRLSLVVQTRVGTLGIQLTPMSTRVQDQSVDYVALGDSFTSGEGEVSDSFYLEHTNNGVHLCHVSARSYPYLLTGVGEALNSACSGAVMKDIVGSTDYKGQNGRIAGMPNVQRESFKADAVHHDRQGIVPQVEYLKKYAPTLASVSIGGNDAGFMDKLRGCIGPGTCEWALPGAARRAVAREIDALYDKYLSLFSSLQQASPGTVIKTVSYPQIINSEEAASCGGVIGTLLSYEERLFMSQSIARVNSVMQRASQDSGIDHISVEDAYKESVLCGNSHEQPAMNGLRLGGEVSPISGLPAIKIIGAESFHPTPYGHSLVAQSIDMTVGSQGQVGSANGSTAGAGYWSEAGDGAVEADFRYYLLTSDVAQHTYDEPVYREVVQEFVFAPHAAVEARYLGSTELIEATTSDDGTIELVLPRPVFSEAGVATLLISGVSAGGENITAYRTIAAGTTGIASIENPAQEDVPAGDESSGEVSSERPHNDRTIARQDSYGIDEALNSTFALSDAMVRIGAVSTEPAESTIESVLGYVSKPDENGDRKGRGHRGVSAGLVATGVIGASVCIGAVGMLLYRRLKYKK